MLIRQIPLIALALLLGGCKLPLFAKANGAQSPPQYTTDVVKRQNLTGYSFFDGKLVIPETARATAFSPLDTPVLAVMTGAGKLVTRGQPIVKLDIAGSDAATSSAKEGVNSAQSDYSTEKGANSDAVREAQKNLDEARAAEKVAKDTPAGGNQPDVQAATQDRKDAEAALKQARQDLRHTLQPSKDAVGQASASLKDARSGAAKGIVRAPISGTVVTLEAQPGMKATASQPLATIVNFNASRVQGLVPAELKDLVVKNSHVIVLMNGGSSEPLDGTVVSIKVVPPTEGQKGPGYLALIKFVNPRAMVKPSISVKRIGVKMGMAKDVLVVPVGAVSKKDGKSIVKVQIGSDWVDTPVELGISDGALVEVKSGLSEGAVVRVQKPDEKV